MVILWFYRAVLGLFLRFICLIVRLRLTTYDFAQSALSQAWMYSPVYLKLVTTSLPYTVSFFRFMKSFSDISLLIGLWQYKLEKINQPSIRIIEAASDEDGPTPMEIDHEVPDGNVDRNEPCMVFTCKIKSLSLGLLWELWISAPVIMSDELSKLRAPIVLPLFSPVLRWRPTTISAEVPVLQERYHHSRLQCY